MTVTFSPRLSVRDVEEGLALAPRFPTDGLMPCVTTDVADVTVLMLGWMNDQALRLTIETGEAHYLSRTRQAVWHSLFDNLHQHLAAEGFAEARQSIELHGRCGGCAGGQQ